MLIVRKMKLRLHMLVRLQHTARKSKLHGYLTGKICVTKIMLMLSTHRNWNMLIGTKYIQRLGEDSAWRKKVEVYAKAAIWTEKTI